jgi:hypothetical protein
MACGVLLEEASTLAAGQRLSFATEIPTGLDALVEATWGEERLGKLRGWSIPKCMFS